MSELSLVINCEEPNIAITSNLAKVKAELEKQLEGFEGKEFKTLKEAKEVRATLNKVFETLESERKRAHKIVEKPYKDFLPIYQEAVARLVECQEFIKAKCTELEDKTKPVLPKKTLAYIVDLDVRQQGKLEEWLGKQGIEFKVKIKE